MRTWMISLGLASAVAAAAGVRPSADPHPAARGIVVVRGDPVARALPASAPNATATASISPQARSASWHPKITDTWQWQLTGKLDTAYDVAVYDIDLFDTPDAVIARLHTQGRRIVCYFSAGSSENWRPDDGQFAAADKGRALDGWAGERWLDIRSANVRRVMLARLDLAATRGCDGVEPDNVDGYANLNGLKLSAADQLDYNRFLAGAARARGLAVGLKNDLAQAKALAPEFDFAVNEQCPQYGECDKLQPFTMAGKPVFNAEYQAKYRDNTAARDRLCEAARAADIRTLVLPLKLNDAYRYACD